MKAKVFTQKTMFFTFLVGLFTITNSLQAQKVDSISVYFETDEFNISPQENNKLTQFLNALATTKINQVTIKAYCDDRGTEEYNNQLSFKRAKSIEAILLNLNFNPQIIQEAIGEGELPLLELSNYNEAQQRALNRKAEITIQHNPVKAKEDSLSKDSNVFKNAKVGDKIVLENILFVGGRGVLLPESFPALDHLAALLNENENLEILILGHVCCTRNGSDGQDFETGKMNLSVVRAKTVYDYLIKNGIDSERLSYKGLKGNFKTGKGDKYDRRVEVKIIKN